jgi:hypothetical protein
LNEKRIEKVLNEMLSLYKYHRLDYLPKNFYRLSDDEKAEVVKQYKEKLGRK